MRITVLVAFVFWLAGATLSVVGRLPNYAIASAAFFVVFFLVFVAYYWSMAFVIDEYGVTYRGATEFEHFDWDEIIHLQSSEIPLGGYYVTTRSGGGFVLSGFIRQHRELAELIAARAGLMPSP